MFYTAVYRSTLGKIIVTAEEQGITGVWFAEPKVAGGKSTQFPTSGPIFADDTGKGAPNNQKAEVWLAQTQEWLACYFSGREPDFLPPLHLQGSPFQQQVWEILRHIPYGQTVSYGDIGREIARERGILRMSAQAVGGAVGRNPVSILVPCHRVIGADGSLVGYGGGLARKRALLMLENSAFQEKRHKKGNGKN